MNHYVYLIEKKNSLPNQEKYYIGVRSCKSKISDDAYMGSSKYLTEDIKINGKNQYNKIVLKRFNNRKEALLYEIELHDKFNVSTNNIFFNKAKQKSTGFSCGPGELNPFYGKKHTEDYKQRQSALLKTKDCRSKTPNFGLVHTKETKLKMSLKRKEWMSINKHPMLGVKKTEKMKLNNSLGALRQAKETCVHCGVSSVPGNIARWHNEKCKIRS